MSSHNNANHRQPQIFNFSNSDDYAFTFPSAILIRFFLLISFRFVLNFNFTFCFKFCCIETKFCLIFSVWKRIFLIIFRFSVLFSFFYLEFNFLVYFENQLVMKINCFYLLQILDQFSHFRFFIKSPLNFSLISFIFIFFRFENEFCYIFSTFLLHFFHFWAKPLSKIPKISASPIIKNRFRWFLALFLARSLEKIFVKFSQNNF